MNIIFISYVIFVYTIVRKLVRYLSQFIYVYSVHTTSEFQDLNIIQQRIVILCFHDPTQCNTMFAIYYVACMHWQSTADR